MHLKVQELLARQRPEELESFLDAAEWLRGSDEFVPLEPLACRLTAQAVDDRVLVDGELACTVRMTCSRCLDPVERKLRVPFSEQFRIAGEDARHRDDDPDDDVVVAEERIDLAPYVAEQFVVQLPFAPLCREDCKGLCPSCGTNRNERSCVCDTALHDMRFAALEDWLKKQQE